nr:MAG TPA: hypothetical protein [Caudoviricetes sp.]
MRVGAVLLAKNLVITLGKADYSGMCCLTE